MAKMTYTLKDFDPIEAKAGVLCVVVKNEYTANQIETIIVKDNKGTNNENFIGAGICRYDGADTYNIVIDNITYKFNKKGEGIYSSANKYKIKLGVAHVNISTSGNAANSSSTTVTTRGDDGTKTETDYSKGSVIMIDNLNARDEFAIRALSEMLSQIPNPSVVSNSEMNFYCNAAYQWAANMMEVAANARGTVTTKKTEGSSGSNTSSSGSVSDSDLSSNTERLLKDIGTALEKSLQSETVSGKTVYSERVKVQFAELITFLNTYVKGDSKTVTDSEGKPSTTTSVLGLKDLIAAIDKLSEGSTGEVSIGNQGLGRDKDHPFYMTGGGFPTRQALAASLDSTAISDFLTFNTNGAVGYSPKAEVKKSILGWLEKYADLNAFYQDLQTKVTETVDTRVKAWLNATTIVSNGSGGYKLSVPSSI